MILEDHQTRRRNSTTLMQFYLCKLQLSITLLYVFEPIVFFLMIIIFDKSGTWTFSWCDVLLRSISTTQCVTCILQVEWGVTVGAPLEAASRYHLLVTHLGFFPPNDGFTTACFPIYICIIIIMMIIIIIYIYTAKYANPLRNAATNITLVFHSSLCDKDDIRLDPLGSPGGLHLDNHNV